MGQLSFTNEDTFFLKAVSFYKNECNSHREPCRPGKFRLLKMLKVWENILQTSYEVDCFVFFLGLCFYFWRFSSYIIMVGKLKRILTFFSKFNHTLFSHTSFFLWNDDTIENNYSLEVEWFNYSFFKKNLISESADPFLY